MNLKWSLFTLKYTPEILKKHLPQLTIESSESLSLLHDYAKFYLS